MVVGVPLIVVTIDDEMPERDDKEDRDASAAEEDDAAALDDEAAAADDEEAAATTSATVVSIEMYQHQGADDIKFEHVRTAVKMGCGISLPSSVESLRMMTQ